MHSAPIPDLNSVFVVDHNGRIKKVGPQSEEAERIRQWRRQYGGRPLSPALEKTTYAQYLAAYDRNLVDRVEAGGKKFQRRFASWCAHRAFERSGLVTIEWLGQLLTKMDSNELTVEEITRAYERLRRDPGIEKVLNPGLPGESENIQQYEALNSLIVNLHDERDRGKALSDAMQAFRAATKTYGMDYQELLDAANRTFGTAAN